VRSIDHGDDDERVKERKVFEEGEYAYVADPLLKQANYRSRLLQVVAALHNLHTFRVPYSLERGARSFILLRCVESLSSQHHVAQHKDRQKQKYQWQ
jgi:hypothetical protein